jgi:hypothetical protein
MHYSELTWRHFEAAAAAGVLTGPGVRRGSAGNRLHGTWVQFDVQVGASGGEATIEAVRFLAFGCPHVIAVADWVALTAAGRWVESRLPESVAALQERFAVPVEKLGRLLVVEDAWFAALSSPLGGEGGAA